MSDYTPITQAQKSHQIQDAPQQKKHYDVDVIALAYYYLVESAATSTETAITKAKQLKSNSLAQEQLNREAGALKWNNIPDRKYDTKWIPHHHTAASGGFIHHWTSYSKKHVWNNQLEIAAAEAQNQNVAAQRQLISNKLSTLQQAAQIKETHVNSITNEAMQTAQEGTSIMDMLKSLTFKALIRNPVRS